MASTKPTPIATKYFSQEAKHKLNIIAGQGMVSDDPNSVLELAVELLYAAMPKDRDERVPLIVVVKKAIDKINAPEEIMPDALDSINKL